MTTKEVENIIKAQEKIKKAWGERKNIYPIIIR